MTPVSLVMHRHDGSDLVLARFVRDSEGRIVNPRAGHMVQDRDATPSLGALIGIMRGAGGVRYVIEKTDGSRWVTSDLNAWLQTGNGVNPA